MPRVVLDTNLLIAAGYSASSASRQIVEACLQGELTAILSPAVRREYEQLLRQALRRDDYRKKLQQLLDRAEVVEPSDTPRVVPEDPDDDKLLAAAVAGNADMLISNDQHLLQLGGYPGVRIMTPREFVRERM